MSKDKEKEIELISMPKSVVQLAEMINLAVDRYWNRELAEVELKDWLWKWAATGKLFKKDDYNKTVAKLSGKRRLEVVDRLLEGYQRKL